MRQIPLHAMLRHAESSEHYAKISKIKPTKKKQKETERGCRVRLSDPRKTPSLPPPGQCPRHTHDDLALAKTPEVNAHPDDVIEPRIRALVQQQRRQAAQGVDEQSGFDAPMHRRQCRGDSGRRSGRGGVGAGVVVSGLDLLGCVVVRGGGRGGGGGVVVV